jgi:hypothetical protein
MIKYILFSLIALSTGYLIFANATTKKTTLKDNAFAKHWYDGKAELSSYDLEQNRYGELHKGHAVLVYVTEDFSKSKQVKLDNPAKAGSDKAPILKLNATKSFLTGIYPYTIINSIFTPIDLSGSVKSACSVQEWCGHTYMQVNKTKDGLKAKQFSYFESEGDSEKTLVNSLLEDELWTMLRIDPKSIPSGKVRLVRGNQAVRLTHKQIEVVNANITSGEETVNGNAAMFLQVEMSDRTLKIYHEKYSPFKILGWDESYAEFGGKTLTTKARLKKTLRLPYWSLHNNEHRIYRDSLGLNNF